MHSGVQGEEYCHGRRKRGGRAAMKKQRAVGDILPSVSPIGVVAARQRWKNRVTACTDKEFT